MQVLQYHVLVGTVPASGFTTTQQFIPTMLTSSMNGTKSTNTTALTSVKGGQVVGGIKVGDNVVITSGLKQNSTVQTAVCTFPNLEQQSNLSGSNVHRWRGARS